MHNLKFLFFLYAFPPMSGTAPKRNYRIASFIASVVKSSKVFTGAIPGNKLRGNDLNIETLPAWDYRKILRRRTADGAVPENKKASLVAQFFIRLINTFPINIIAGEGGIVYFINLLRKGGRSIKEDGITHLYSSYRPFADHYAAYILKKRNPQVYWIADFRDLMIDPHYHHILFSERHQSFFKKVFAKADLLTTVSDGLAKHLLHYNSNVITLRNGVPNDFEKPQASKSPHFTIVYSGSMFLDKRNAEPIFQAVQELFQETKFDLENIKIIYAGKDGKQWRQLATAYRFESIFEDKGILTDEEAKDLQHTACVNVLLTISSDELQGVLTGKMTEYFEAGVPVLGIVVNQNDPELQTILHSIEIGTSFSDQYNDVEGIKSFLLKEYECWKQSKTNRIAINVEKLRENYSMDAVMKPLFEKLTTT